MEPAKTLTKADLSRRLMNDLDISKKDAALLVNLFFKSITSALKSGEDVQLRGFGSFRLKARNAWLGRNPRSGQAVYVPSRRVVQFKIGKDLRGKLIDDAERL